MPESYIFILPKTVLPDENHVAAELGEELYLCSLTSKPQNGELIVVKDKNGNVEFGKFLVMPEIQICGVRDENDLHTFLFEEVEKYWKAVAIATEQDVRNSAWKLEALNVQ